MSVSIASHSRFDYAYKAFGSQGVFATVKMINAAIATEDPDINIDNNNSSPCFSTLRVRPFLLINNIDRVDFNNLLVQTQGLANLRFSNSNSSTKLIWDRYLHVSNTPHLIVLKFRRMYHNIYRFQIGKSSLKLQINAEIILQDDLELNAMKYEFTCS
jgi:hypothetical protein